MIAIFHSLALLRIAALVVLVAGLAGGPGLVAAQPAAPAAAPDISKGLLWRIDQEGTTRGYLFGTIHLAHPQVSTPGPHVLQAMAASDAVVTELAMDADHLQGAAAALLLPPGQSLKSIVGGEVFRELLPAMAGRGIPEELVERLRPFAVIALLVIPPGSDQPPLDGVIYYLGQRLGKRVAGLETLEEQVRLTDSLDPVTSRVVIGELLRLQALIPGLVTQLIEAYSDEDLRRLEELSDSGLPMSAQALELQRRFNRRLVDERNHTMADRMEALFRQGVSFVAVGALHLPGEEGLLRLLQRRGYRLTRVVPGASVTGGDVLHGAGVARVSVPAQPADQPSRSSMSARIRSGRVAGP